MSTLLVDLSRRVRSEPEYEGSWATQLLAIVPCVKTAEDIKDWLGALTPGICVSRPGLLPDLSARMTCLLGAFTPKEVSECITICFDTAWAVSQAQSPAVWANLCAGLQRWKLPATEALQACMQRQLDQGRLPANGQALIIHVNWFIAGMRKYLPSLGYGAVQDTGTDRHAIAVRGAVDEMPMQLGHDVLMLAMACVLRDMGIEWMQPQSLPGERQEDFQYLHSLRLVDKECSARFRPMVANYSWLQSETAFSLRFQSIRSSELAIHMGSLIKSLVDLSAEKVALMKYMPGVAQRRFDLMLRALFSGAMHSQFREGDKTWNGMLSVYLQLHDRAVLQMTTGHQAMSPRFAQHIDLSALPLQFLTMAYRMLGPAPQNFLPVVQWVEWVAGNHLLAYPQHVQAQTLISLSSALPNPELRKCLEKLMAASSSWPRLPDEWLRCQWSNLDSMLALIENPRKAPGNAEHEASMDVLLAGLRQHHGVSDEPLLIDNPFGEIYVPWTLADIRLLAALCTRAVSFGDWKRPELVECLVDFLRQICLVSVADQSFVGPGLLEAFPISILQSAFFQLTPREQGLMLTRVHSADIFYMHLIQIFAANMGIEVEDRLSTLRRISGLDGQGLQCKALADQLIVSLESNWLQQ